MTTEKRKELEAAGWHVGNAEDFLGLTTDESAYIELKLALSRELRKRRERSGMTQSALARRIGSSQSRIAKAEACAPSISVDLMIRALIATGWSAWTFDKAAITSSFDLGKD